MKNFKDRVYSWIVVFVIGLLSLISCSHDNALDPYEYGKVYMAQARQYPAQYELEYTDSIQTLYYSAKLGGPSTISSSIPVSFKIVPSLVDTFNIDNNTSYQIMPPKSYKMEKKELIIPAGERASEVLSIEITAKGNLKKNVKYLLPVKMTVEGGDIPINKNLQIAYYLVNIPAEQPGDGDDNLPIFDRSNWLIHDFSSEDAKQPAKNILDGDPGTLWQGQFRDGPNAPLPHSVSINLGQSHIVHGVKINPKHTNKKSLPSKIKVQFSDDGENWRDSETFINPWTIENFEVKRLDLSKPVKARYIRIVILEDYGDVPVTGLAEVYAYGKLPLLDRSNWLIHDFSSEDAKQPAKNILDGDAGTLWQGQFRDGPNAPLPHSVSINMGQLYVVSGLKINPKHANKKSLPSKIEVQFSDDGKNWRDSETFTNPWTFENFEAKRIDLSDPVMAQYIRITILEDYGDVPVTGLAEVYAY